MRCFALTHYLAASLATSPAESLNSLHSSQGTTSVRKLRSAVMNAPVVASSTSAMRTTDEPSTRRSALQSILFGGTAVAFMAPVGARALDMDAFANSQLDADTKNCDPKKDPKCIPKLNADEALCKYGQSGKARGEACARVKEAGGSLAKPGSQGKSPGGAYAM